VFINGVSGVSGCMFWVPLAPKNSNLLERFWFCCVRLCKSSFNTVFVFVSIRLIILGVGVPLLFPILCEWFSDFIRLLSFSYRCGIAPPAFVLFFVVRIWLRVWFQVEFWCVACCRVTMFVIGCMRVRSFGSLLAICFFFF